MKLTRTIVLGIAFLMPSVATTIARADDKPAAAAPAAGAPAAEAPAADGEKKAKKKEEGRKEEGPRTREPRRKRLRLATHAAPAEKK